MKIRQRAVVPCCDLSRASEPNEVILSGDLGNESRYPFIGDDFWVGADD
jgi:hypothetical protein